MYRCSEVGRSHFHRISGILVGQIIRNAQSSRRKINRYADILFAAVWAQKGALKRAYKYCWKAVTFHINKRHKHFDIFLMYFTEICSQIELFTAKIISTTRNTQFCIKKFHWILWNRNINLFTQMKLRLFNCLNCVSPALLFIVLLDCITIINWCIEC